MAGTGIGEGYDANAVTHGVRSDRRPRLGFEQGDHIGRRHDRPPVELGDQEFILERDAQPVWPRGSSSPSTSLSPRAKPPTVRRSTSLTRPLKIISAPSAARIASTGSSWRARLAQLSPNIGAERQSAAHHRQRQK